MSQLELTGRNQKEQTSVAFGEFRPLVDGCPVGEERTNYEPTIQMLISTQTTLTQK